MPPKAKFTKEEVINAAIEIIRENGMKGLTARTLGKALNSSVCPIFTLFDGMEAVQAEAINEANRRYQAYLKEEMERGEYPPYKGSGIGYIRFAKEEKELFKLLFMRERTKEEAVEDREAIRPLLELLQKQLNVDEDKAYLFHLEAWIYVHGLASMIATSYLEWDMEFISNALTDFYMGLKSRYEEGVHGRD